MAATDAKPVPQKGVAYRHYFAIRKNDGTLITTWAGQDSEVDKDGAGFADCTNEATEIGTTGVGYIDITSTEMNADAVNLKVTVTNTDAVPYVVTFFPEEAGDIRVNATEAGGQTVSATAGVDLDDIATLEARLTAARAGYLDNINGHTAQTGDSFARIGAAGVGLTEAGGDGDHLTEAGGTGDQLTALATSATQTLLDYDNAIWVDPDGGTDGSTDGTHGKRSNPCKTWANVDSLLTARTLKKVRVIGSGTLTLTSVPSGKTGIDLDSGCSLAFSISGVTVPASAILTVTGGYQVTMTNLNVSNSGSTLILQDVQRVTGSPSGGAGVGIARLIRCRCSSSWQFLGFAEVGIHDCWHDHSASGWYTVSATTGHMTITGWDGGIELDPSGTGHIHFIGRSNDLTISGSSGAVELTGEIVYTNNGTGTLTVDTSGITMKEGVDGDTGKTLSDEIATVDTVADAIKVVTDALTQAAAAKLALSAGTIVEGTVDTGSFAATTTQFEADDITEATADHYIGRIIIFTSGALQYQATDITDYSLSGANGHFTVSALTEAPANDVTFIII